MKNISSSISSTLEDAAAATNTLSAGGAMVKNMTSGYPALSYKTAKRWTSGWPHGRDLLYLR